LFSEKLMGGPVSGDIRRNLDCKSEPAPYVVGNNRAASMLSNAVISVQWTGNAEDDGLADLARHGSRLAFSRKQRTKEDLSRRKNFRMSLFEICFLFFVPSRR